MENPWIDIIIPVYKTEKYLNACLQCVLDQDYPCIHVLLVDDGSPDQCPALCDALAANYENVDVLHKENSGLGLSRNTGFDATSNPYIMFIDSDDMLDGKSAVSSLIQKAETEKADIVVGGFTRMQDDGSCSTPSLPEFGFTNTPDSKDFRFNGFYLYGHLSYAWGKIYRRSFLVKYQIYSHAYPFTQDKPFNFECYINKPVYAFVNQSIYLYRVNTQSVTFKYKKNYIQVWNKIGSDFYHLLEEKNLVNEYQDLAAWHYFLGTNFMMMQEYNTGKGHKEAVNALKRYFTLPLAKKSIRLLAEGTIQKNMKDRKWTLESKLAAGILCHHWYGLYVSVMHKYIRRREKKKNEQFSRIGGEL